MTATIFDKVLTKKQQALVASYARSVIGAALAAYVASGNDPKAALNGLWAALLPVLIRWANPKDSSFGRGSESSK